MAFSLVLSDFYRITNFEAVIVSVRVSDERKPDFNAEGFQTFNWYQVGEEHIAPLSNIATVTAPFYVTIPVHNLFLYYTCHF